MTRLAPFALLPLVFFSACSTVAAPVALFKPLGTRQCESGGPAPEAVAQVLRDAGVAVAAVACGHDGRMRPAVCGAADGRLVIVDVPVDQQARAEALGSRIVGTVREFGNGTRFTLENGQIWQIVDSTSGFYDLQNPPVTIERAVLGSFLMTIEGVNQRPRVRRIR